MKNEATKLNLPVLLVVGAIALAGGFFGGMRYQQSKRASLTLNGANGTFQGPGRGGQFGGGTRNGMMRPVDGEIIAADSKSITVKMSDGSTKIVLLSATTSINKQDPASVSDLQIGTKVAVFGQTNSDGSVTAQNIQLNPMMRIFQTSTPSAQPDQVKTQ